jgi:hypothetical protein
MRSLIEDKCDRMTIRVKVLKLQGTQESITNRTAVTTIFKVEVADLSKKAFLLLKHVKDKKYNLFDNELYIADKLKLLINKKGEIVLVSTSSTSNSISKIL